jgi:hypothetical protein
MTETEHVQTLELDFHLAPGGDDADLERSAAALTQTVSALPGVDEAGARVADPVRDPMTAVAVLLSVTVVIKQADGAVQALDKLVNDVKQLARDAGLPHLWIWLRRKKVRVEDLTADDLKDLAAQAPDD